TFSYVFLWPGLAIVSHVHRYIMKLPTLSLLRLPLLLTAIAALSSTAVFAQKPDSTRVVNTDTIRVKAERPYSAASNASFRAADVALRPRNSAQDLLRLVPGLVIAQHAGGGKAEQIFLRGFDADHGTDVNISVDDAPVNM